ncbi:type IV pilus modification protein PilV [Rivibacter subsaxonicus]|uniref:Type IV pilus assembly protein PilV n=1 Tax=Rivibacter subsaxonicus TaxID=457575 RepID=A0A4Q7VV33_9BURK|nr:type IV pilus modification protein PilV [Rivibacter subsaxonicus]RZU00522.1 type IV pilus assembly protein PilV [Rivibacter subsaxonicus]
MKKTSSRPRRRPQSGFMLLEVLVAILIFAIGVLSLVGLQVASIKESTQAKYRADATLLANDLISRMWVTDRSFATIDAQFDSAGPGAAYTAWLPAVQAALPGSAATPPVVTVESVAGGGAAGTPSSRVTLTLSWKAPTEPVADPPHNLTVVTQIK